MKATIIRPDGTRIEAEGTPEEVAKLALPAFVPLTQPVCLCCGGILTGVWCPVHGYRPTVAPYVIYSVQNVAAAAPPPSTVFLGNVNCAGALS